MSTSQVQDAKEIYVLPSADPSIPPKNGICLVNNLPPELTSRIFELCHEDDGSDSEAEGIVLDRCWDGLRQYIERRILAARRFTNAPETIEEGQGDGDTDSNGSGPSDSPYSWLPFRTIASHVCHHWRSIAISTPSLWTTIEVYPVAHRSFELEPMQLERSKSLPINIGIDCVLHEYDYDVKPPSEADLRSVFSTLIAQTHRWRALKVEVPDYHSMHMFLSAVSDPSISAAPRLTTLQLYHEGKTEEFENFPYPSMSKHFTIFGGSAPLLTRLVLWGVHVDWNQPWISSALNLKDLELVFHAEDVRPSWAQFASILRGAPALEKLSLRQSGPSGNPEQWIIHSTPGTSIDVNAPISLPRLTDFIFALHSPERAIGLLRRLHLPALKNLVLAFHVGNYTNFTLELAGPATSFQAAQGEPRSLLDGLDSLRIAGLPCGYRCIEALYGELQNATSLYISLHCVSEEFLTILGTRCTMPGREDTWLPRLERLYITEASGEALCKVVLRRRRLGAPLSLLYVMRGLLLYEWHVDWLEKNLETFEFDDTYYGRASYFE